MSGHSKWTQIKHRKAATDKKRGQLFSKLSKLVSLAARKSANLENNIELKHAVDRAKSMDMPIDNINRAINKARDKSGSQLDKLVIEAIGPGNVALRIKAITDNKNRTVSELKKILGDHGAKMVSPGSISWMFNQSVTIENQTIGEEIDELCEAIDDHGDVEDIISNLKERLVISD